MMDHIEKVKDGLDKIKEGFAQLNSCPASYSLDCLLAAYMTLVSEYAKFDVGQRVQLLEIPTSALNRESGWWHCRHFLVPGNPATVRHIACDSDGRLRYDVEFDRETWIDMKGIEQPVIAKHIFCLFERELSSYEVVQP
jgi:hypothetical protein